jgi:putative nucleotidyltransferase with HDIG domain
LIELDQALTANVLRMANSVMGSARTQIETVKDAVVRLGTAQIFKLAVGSQVAGPMSTACPGYELAEHELWRHSVAAALAAEYLSEITPQPIPKLAFTSALLHDIGKLLLGRDLGGEVLENILSIMHQEHITFLEAEHRVLGTDHAEVGGEIARHWAFPEPLIEAITFHHDPDQQPSLLLDAVHLSNAVAKFIGVGLGREQMNMDVSSETPKRMGLSIPQLETLCARVRIDLARAEEQYKI